MKKMIIGTISAALVLSMAVTGAFAAGNGYGRGRNFIDANGDGVCDNYGTGRGQYFYGTGRGQYFYGTGRGQYFYGTGRGQYFVDADGDGICDNYGTGMGRGCGQGQGRYCRR